MISRINFLEMIYEYYINTVFIIKNKLSIIELFNGFEFLFQKLIINYSILFNFKDISFILNFIIYEIKILSFHFG